MASDERAAKALVAEELDELLEDVTAASERETLYASIAANVRSKPLRASSVSKADFMGAFTSFWLVVITSAPAAIPFLLFDDARFALRVSNAILLAFLFVTGYLWARFTLGRPWLVGLALLVGGFVLVGVAILLGG
jgi:VIT1/CCC1 family predicted Fe2+/Mn2+ transporter